MNMPTNGISAIAASELPGAEADAMKFLTEVLYPDDRRYDGIMFCHDKDDGYFLGKMDEWETRNIMDVCSLTACAKNIPEALGSFLGTYFPEAKASTLFGKLGEYVAENTPVILTRNSLGVYAMNVPENEVPLYETMSPIVDGVGKKIVFHANLCEAIVGAVEYQRLKRLAPPSHFRP